MTLIDTLESRQLMSVSLDPATHVLTITGKDSFDSPDEIVVSMDAGKLKVSDNGVVKKFDPAQVNKIKILARAGSDLVDVNTAVTKPTEIDTGTGGPYTDGDRIYGGGGKDTIYARSLYHHVFGRGGNDTIYVSGPTGTVNAGAGNDTVIVTDSTDRTITGGDGTDTIDYAAFGTGMVLRNGFSGFYYADTDDGSGLPIMDTSYGDTLSAFENFNGTQGKDFILGTSGRNILKGNGGNDKIYGYAGNDELYGGVGDDALFGGAGHNALYGGDGNDFLNASNSNVSDFLSGGTGKDTGSWDASDIVTGVEVKA